MAHIYLQKELAVFLEKQQAEARLHQSIHNFTGIWFVPCVTGTPSTRFSRGEESCLSNCVERFLDTSLFMVRKIEEQRSALENGNGKFT
ncbi:hypothetical protein B0H16DRAFT_1295574 [Mycena metata]|uniref:Mitochondrial import inner membrane translocase subunit n=1 Tax=Mycena metata TaxID=1033252 RepID=A0AAD7KJ69_9AGAR|nr:hypothetical protein B0H16DRAFT_1295574 [Mycena metata]